GVAGRSKGCDNCRRRHIKCDLGQPACGRCVKADLKCGGSRDITFVHYEVQTPDDEISRASSSSPQRNSLVVSETPTFTPWSLLGAELSVSQDDMFVNYTRANLLHNIESNSIWVPEIDRKLGDASLLALATIFFGTEHRDSALIQRGLQKYSFTIEELNAALRDSTHCYSSDLFDAILTMALLEFHISERDRGWLNHACGLERLIELRGPETFMSLLDLMLFEQTRSLVLFAALTLRKPTILSRSEWKTIPWTLYPDRKTYMQMLLDILADCPELLAAKTELESDPFGSLNSEKRQELAIMTQGVLERLDTFEEAWISANSTCVWEVSPPGLTPPIPSSEGEQIPLWSTVLHYQSLDHANVAMMGCAVRILVLIIYRDLPWSMSTTTAEQISTQLFKAIITVCRSLDYQFQEINKGASSHSMFYPIKVALIATIYDYPTIGNWLKGILDHLSDGFAAKWSVATRNLR
ncbi:hypothetical protein BGW36DRAFT_305965, partial [Talaromyces proteolyticus]